MSNLRTTVGLLLLAGAPFARAQAQTAVRWDGRHTIVDLVDGGKVVVKAEEDQVGIEQIAVSPQGGLVGWVTTIRGCCTSYSIPHALKVYVGGRVRVLSRGMPVWYWEFQSGGALAAYMVNTTHGNEFGVYELREVSTGRLRARFVGGKGKKEPTWVSHLEATRARRAG